MELVSAAPLKTFARELAGGFGTADMRIYDLRRLVRLPFARHKSSGLYRIPLTHADLYGPLDRIVDAAREPEGFGYNVNDLYERPDSSPLKDMFNASIALNQTTKERTSRTVLRDYFLPAPPGQRNACAAKLAGLIKHKGVDLQLAQLFMQTWNRTNPEPLPNDELSHLVAGIYKRYTN
jgi:hypothetical protein